MSETSAPPVKVRDWSFLIGVVTSFALLIMWLTNLHAQAEETERRVRELEARPTVTYQQYKDGQDEIKERLKRIETKIDDKK